MAKTVFQDTVSPGTKVTASFLNGMNNHRHTGLDQDGDGAIDYAADTGAANAYVVALTPPLTAHVVGMPIRLMVANANTGASTLNEGGGAAPIKKFGSQPLVAGDLNAGQIIEVIYDGTNFQLMSRPGFSEVPLGATIVLSGGTATNWTSINLSSVVPAAAKRVRLAISSLTCSGNTVNVSPTNNGYGAFVVTQTAAAGSAYEFVIDLPLYTPQTIWYQVAGSGTVATIAVLGYGF